MPSRYGDTAGRDANHRRAETGTPRHAANRSLAHGEVGQRERRRLSRARRTDCHRNRANWPIEHRSGRAARREPKGNERGDKETRLERACRSQRRRRDQGARPRETRRPANRDLTGPPDKRRAPCCRRTCRTTRAPLPLPDPCIPPDEARPLRTREREKRPGEQAAGAKAHYRRVRAGDKTHDFPTKGFSGAQPRAQSRFRPERPADGRSEPSPTSRENRTE
ncbi:hypothetical protein B0G57_101420 [Trinickia symbiotica]|nr:hypothetical protein B0G57_101420 [Trinickia symbiotica]